jgi:hypothetical protein
MTGAIKGHAEINTTDDIESFLLFLRLETELLISKINITKNKSNVLYIREK